MLSSTGKSHSAVNVPGQHGHSVARDRAPPVSVSASTSGVGWVFVLKC